MHFAAFKGNIKIIKILLEFGGDPFLNNEFGLNMLHVSAQGDSATSLYVFKELGLNLN